MDDDKKQYKEWLDDIKILFKVGGQDAYNQLSEAQRDTLKKMGVDVDSFKNDTVQKFIKLAEDSGSKYEIISTQGKDAFIQLNNGAKIFLQC